MATIRARLAPLEDRVRLSVTQALRTAARRLVLGAVAAAFALVGLAYMLIGLWLGLESLLGPTGASFALGALFLIFSAIPLALLNRMTRKPISADEPR